MASVNHDCQYWSRMARDFDGVTRFVVGERTQQQLKGWLQEQIDPAHGVLELGCGTGFFSEIIARSAHSLVATDLSREMLSVAEDRLGSYGNVTIQQEDCCHTSFRDERFDTVFMGNLIHIVPEPALVMAETHRLLRENGKVILIDSTASGLPLWPKLRMGFRYLRRFGVPPKNNRNMTPEEIAGIVRNAGLRVVDSALIGHESKAICLTARKQRGDGNLGSCVALSDGESGGDVMSHVSAW